MPEPFPSEEYLREELRALEEEGFDVAEPYRRLRAIAGLPESETFPARQTLLASLDTVPRRPDFPYDEPSELAAIRAARPEGARRLPPSASADALEDKTLGAWLGRAAGCLLGKPCEFPGGRMEPGEDRERTPCSRCLAPVRLLARRARSTRRVRASLADRGRRGENRVPKARRSIAP